MFPTKTIKIHKVQKAYPSHGSYLLCLRYSSKKMKHLSQGHPIFPNIPLKNKNIIEISPHKKKHPSIHFHRLLKFLPQDRCLEFHSCRSCMAQSFHGLQQAWLQVLLSRHGLQVGTITMQLLEGSLELGQLIDHVVLSYLGAKRPVAGCLTYSIKNDGTPFHNR